MLSAEPKTIQGTVRSLVYNKVMQMLFNPSISQRNSMAIKALTTRKDEVAQIESGRSDSQDEYAEVESKGYADPSIQNQTQEILNSPDSRAIERQYLRKLDLIILPTVSALYFFEYLDRGNIAVGHASHPMSSCYIYLLFRRMPSYSASAKATTLRAEVLGRGVNLFQLSSGKSS